MQNRGQAAGCPQAYHECGRGRKGLYGFPRWTPILQIPNFVCSVLGGACADPRRNFPNRHR